MEVDGTAGRGAPGNIATADIVVAGGNTAAEAGSLVEGAHSTGYRLVSAAHGEAAEEAAADGLDVAGTGARHELDAAGVVAVDDNPDNSAAAVGRNTAHRRLKTAEEGEALMGVVLVGFAEVGAAVVGYAQVGVPLVGAAQALGPLKDIAGAEGVVK